MAFSSLTFSNLRCCLHNSAAASMCLAACHGDLMRSWKYGQHEVLPTNPFTSSMHLSICTGSLQCCAVLCSVVVVVVVVAGCGLYNPNSSARLGGHCAATYMTLLFLEVPDTPD